MNKYKSDFDVNIHRDTFWGNYVGKDAGSREAAIELFKKILYVELNPEK
ncbi:MAG: protein of unknown function DUF4326 [Bacteriophage sp.]|nr:MAG: protein of unknown function DUF4326 [Bacteriophage sp.]